MEYSIIDNLPATIVCASFMARKKFYVFKPDVPVVHFFHIIKTVAGINNQLLTTKPNIKEWPAWFLLHHFLFIFINHRVA